MKRLLILAALLTAACQPMPAAEATAQTPAPVPSAANGTDAAACAAQGGKMLPLGRMQSVRCVITFADAGRRCTDSDQCAGDCRLEGEPSPTRRPGSAAVGQCQVSSADRFGCFTNVEDGKIDATLCVD